jgi:hypothetical protein
MVAAPVPEIMIYASALNPIQGILKTETSIQFRNIHKHELNLKYEKYTQRENTCSPP